MEEAERGLVRNGETSEALRGQKDAVILLCVQEAHCGGVSGSDLQGERRQSGSWGGQSQLLAAGAAGSWRAAKP